MNRPTAILGSMFFLSLVLGVVVVYFPYIFCYWRFAPPFFGFAGFNVLGILMCAAGLLILLDSYLHFALRGMGTPAPVAPPRHLVVSGAYHYVRNPMYVAVIAAVWGQGLFFGNAQVMRYGLYLWAGFFAFVVLYEEPVLKRKFGQEYMEYCRRVPRWFPRLKPYRPS